MTWVSDEVLAPIRRRYGQPADLSLEHEISPWERDLVRSSGRSGRRHDVTFFVFHGQQLALIRKPHFAPGIWRPPGGGIRRGESFEAGAVREAKEELGVDITIDRYLLRIDALFTCEREQIPWQTHVVAASTESSELAPIDKTEIAAARWGSVTELQGPIRSLLLGTDRGLWRYRVALHDASIARLKGRRHTA